MSDVPLPAEAVSVAAEAIHCAQNASNDEPERWEAHRLATVALQAAQPVIAAAERARLLATPLGSGGLTVSEYPLGEGADEWSRGYRTAMADFADLLRREPS